MRPRPFLSRLSLVLLVAGFFFAATPASIWAAPPAVRVLPTEMGFDALAKRLSEAVAANGMGVVARASASASAAARGIEVPGNMVVMVFRNDFALRMLAASVPAGIEAPLRFYVTENAAGGATLSYPLPSQVFAPYGSAALDRMAAELDTIFARIADDAVAAR